MADPLTMSLLMAGGSGLLNALFGGDNEFKMSRQQREILNMLMGEYQRGEFGPSGEEQAGILRSIKGDLQKETQAQTARGRTSLARRGLLSPGQAAGMATEAQAGFGEAFGEARSGIAQWAGSEARREKGQLRGLLASLSGGQYVPGGDVPGLGGLGQNAMLAYLLKQGQGQGSQGDGGFSNIDWRRYFG